MLIFDVDCGHAVLLHFRATNALCKFRLFNAQDETHAIAESPDNNGSWIHPLPAGSFDPSITLTLQASVITQGGGAADIRLRVENSGDTDVDPEAGTETDHSAQGWLLGSVNSGSFDTFDFALICQGAGQ